MARTYSSTPVLSKIKIGDTTYWLKDADARGLLDSIDGSIWAQLLAGFGDVATGGDKFVKASDIKSYVDNAVEAALEIVVLAELPTADKAAWDTYHNSIVLIPKASAQSQNAKDEYIIMRTAGAESGTYNYAWEKIGDTNVDLSGYVTDVKWASGNKLQQKKGNGSYADVHTFGDMADADTASTTLSDYVTGVSSAKVTAAGGLKKDATNGVQISGSIGAITVINSVGSAPSFTEGAFVANVPTAIDTTKFNGGSKAADTFSANTPTAIDVSKFNGGSATVIDTTKFNGGSAASLGAGFYSAGSAASKAADTFVKPTLSTLTKALYKQGMKAEVGTGDNAETLIISNVDKEADIKVVDEFTQGSFTEGAFTPNTPTAIDTSKFNGGAAASLGSGFYTPGAAASLGSGFYTPGSAASFTEGSFTPAAIQNGFYTPGSAASKAADTFSAGSVPTTKSVTPTFTGDKFAFEGTEVNATVTLSKGNKTVQVSPDAGE